MNFVQVITIPPLVTLPLSLVQVMKVHPPLITSPWMPIPWEKCLYQDKHVTLASEAATAPSPAMDANLHTIKNAIVFISEHILVQFGVSK